MPHSGVEDSVFTRQAISETDGTFGDDVSVAARQESLLKFGQTTAASADTKVTLAEFPGAVVEEVFATSNIIDTMSSAGAGDTQDVIIEGHTVDGSGDFTFVKQTATLNGQNKVTLTIPLARVQRAANDSSTEWTGGIYIYSNGAITLGVPDVDADVRLFIPAGDQKSFKCAVTLAQTDYWFLCDFYITANRASTAAVDWSIEIREKGKTFLPRVTGTIRSDGTGYSQVSFFPYIVIPKNADIRVSITPSKVTTVVCGFLNGFLAKIV